MNKQRFILLFTVDPQTINTSPGGLLTYGDYVIHLNPDPSIVYDAVFCYEAITRPIKVNVRKGCLIFIPGETPYVKSFSTPFINQFNHLMTFREDLIRRFKSKNIIITNCVTPWRLGLDENLERAGAPRSIRSYDTIKEYIPFKSFNISMVVSNKPGTPLQRTRMKLAQLIHQHLPQIELFGRGVRDIPDKSVALDNFRFSIGIENSEVPNYFTEKITDCILSHTIPLYWGCPNINDYFNITKACDLFILDPYDMNVTINKLAYIHSNAETLYKTYLPELLRDKQKILDEYSILPRMIQAMPIVNNTYKSIYGDECISDSVTLQSDEVGYYA